MRNRKKLVSILAGVMAAIMILSLLLSILPTRAFAASSSEIRKQINQLKENRTAIKNDINELKAKYAENEDEIADIVARKNIIDQEISLIHAELLNIEEQITAYGVLIADKQDELDAAVARFDTLNEAYKIRIRAMEEEGTLSYWEVLFKATSFSNLLDRLNMVEEIANSDQRRLRELGEAANEVASAQEELTTEKAALEETKEEQIGLEAELDEKRIEADGIIQELLEKAAEIEGLQEQLEEEDEALLLEIAQKEKEYTKAKNAEYQAWLATSIPPTTKPVVTIKPPSSSGGSSSGGGSTSGISAPSGGGSWRVPCSYVMVSSKFGPRVSPTSGASTNHMGVDLAAPAGTPIYASRGGTVTGAYYSGSGGNMVTINHGDGFSSVYMHMTNYIVSAGQAVSQGQVIGYVGSTGISTGNHLHFGITFNGAYVNPNNYVGLY